MMQYLLHRFFHAVDRCIDPGVNHIRCSDTPLLHLFQFLLHPIEVFLHFLNLTGKRELFMCHLHKLLPAPLRQAHERFFLKCRKGETHLGQSFDRRLTLLEEGIIAVFQVRIDTDIQIGLHIKGIAKNFGPNGFPRANVTAGDDTTPSLDENVMPRTALRMQNDIVDKYIAPPRYWRVQQRRC